MREKITHIGRFNLELLHEQLQSFRVLDTNGEYTSEYTIAIMSNGINLYLELDLESTASTAKRAAVVGILERHNFSGTSQQEINREAKRTRKVAAKTKLKTITGLTDDDLNDLEI